MFLNRNPNALGPQQHLLLKSRNALASGAGKLPKWVTVIFRKTTTVMGM
jgi:hypothetical protein